MPAVLNQINALSVSDKMQVMKYLVMAIEKAVSEAEKAAPTRRCLSPDPALYCRINGDLFEDTSSDWENA